MKKSIKIIIISIILSVNLFSSAAQIAKIGIPEVEFYDRIQYSAGSQNWKITQNNYGLLFFANNAGLLSFDGLHWKLDKRKYPGGLKMVNYLDGQLYVGNYNEFGVEHFDSLQQLIFHPILGDEELKHFGDYWNALKYNDQIAFFTEKAIVFVKDEKVTKIVPAISRFLGFYSVNNRLLLHDKEKGLLEYKNETITPLVGGSVMANVPVGAILPLSKSQFVIATLSEGLYLADASGISKWNVVASPLLAKANVFCGATYQDDVLVFGTLQKGVVAIDKRGDIVSQIDKDKGLHNNTVLSLFVDREDNLWCGLDNGIAKVKFNSSLTFLNDNYELGTGYAIERFKGDYYIGTSQGLYKISENKFKDPLKDKNDFERISGSVAQHWSLYSDGDNLLCGSNFGILDVDGKNAKIISPVTVNGGWCFKEFINNPDNLLVGTYDGLVLLNKRGGKWQFITKIEGFAESGRFIEWESENTLLVAHSFNGVYRLHFNPSFTKVTSIDSLAFTDFPGNKLDLTLSKIGGRALFTSNVGIYTLKVGSNKPERVSEFDTFFAKDLFPTSLKEDAFGNIWFVSISEMGVLRKLEDGTFKKITYPFLPLKNRMVNFFQTSFVIDKDNVFFNTDNGFAHYSVSDRINYQQPFNVHITSFKSVNDSTTHYFYQYGKTKVEQKVIPHFAFANNSFDVDYAATFYNDKNIVYSTFLKGADEKPSAWSTKSSRTIAGLKEGNYELIIYAENSYKVQANSVSFQFVVDPPWYRSNYAKTFYLLLFLISLILGVEVFKRYIFKVKSEISEEHRVRFKAKEDQLLYDALMKEKEFIQIKNEKLNSEMSSKEKELANLTVHVVKKNDFLSDLKDQLRRVITTKETTEYARKITNIIKKIDSDIENENNWTAFERQFELVHASFLTHLLEKHPSLNLREQKLCAYIKMGLSSKEIASLMNITTQAVENNRSKLRQSLGLNTSDNLAKYIGSI